MQTGVLSLQLRSELLFLFQFNHILKGGLTDVSPCWRMPNSHGKPWETETHISTSFYIHAYIQCTSLLTWLLNLIRFFIPFFFNRTVAKVSLCKIIFYQCPYVFTLIFKIELYLRNHEKLRPEFFKTCHKSEDGFLKYKDL